MGWSHPETIPLPQSMEELSSIKQVPDAKKVGDHWFNPTMEAIVHIFVLYLIKLCWAPVCVRCLPFTEDKDEVPVLIELTL